MMPVFKNEGDVHSDWVDIQVEGPGQVDVIAFSRARGSARCARLSPSVVRKLAIRLLLAAEEAEIKTMGAKNESL